MHAFDSLPCSHLVYPTSGPAFAPSVIPGANLVAIQNIVYFVAADESRPTADQTIWRTDGTPAGTFPIERPTDDFVPLMVLTTLGDKILLVATTPASGSELWVSDGSKSGTRLLQDIAPGPKNSALNPLFTFQGRLYFSASGQAPAKLWVTDGTAEQTILASEIYSGEIPLPSYPFLQDATNVYFFSYINQFHDQLWHLDANGMHQIKDFTGVDSADNTNYTGALVKQAGNLYFFHRTAGGDSGLWRSDGTEAGTQLISSQTFIFYNDDPQMNGVYPELHSVGNDLFFFERDTPLIRLWRLDTSAGTVSLVKTIRIPATPGTFYDLFYLGSTVYADKLYFTLSRDDHNEIWVTDGTETGTQPYMFLPLRIGGAFHATSLGMFMQGGFNEQTLIFVPWANPYPTAICNLGSHLYFYPNLFEFNQQIYISGRKSLPAGMEVLWRIDPTELHPTNLFLPLSEK